MKERLFRFKHFSVRHALSSMKVGVDGVLIGAWSDVAGVRCLDVGTGCGLIALMLAQRNEMTNVVGIDIDTLSVEEAKENVLNSPWHDRIEIREISFKELISEIETGRSEKYDVIVSNPPYFDAGVRPDSRREKARHDGELSPMAIIKASPHILYPGGKVSIIVPADRYEELIRVGKVSGLHLKRACYVRNSDTAPDKRVMLEFVKPDSIMSEADDPEINRLIMFETGAEPTVEYRRLCGEFYLKF